VPQRTSDGEAPDPHFAANELLYRRYRRDHLVNGQLRPQDFGPLPGVSVNRQKYSNCPEDVLHPDCANRRLDNTWGILSFTVGSVENGGPFKHEGSDTQYEFYLRHDPGPLCKPHSEIWCRDARSKEDVANPSRTVRNLFRLQLSRLINVVRPAA
jgi:hypothetical protein